MSEQVLDEEAIRQDERERVAAFLQRNTDTFVSYAPTTERALWLVVWLMRLPWRTPDLEGAADGSGT